MNFIKLVALCAPVAAVAAHPAFAQDFSAQSANEAITLSGGVGVLAIESREYVFNDTGSERLTSLLIWQTKAPMLNANLDVQLPQGWSVGASVDAALGGDSHMVDYDWLDPFQIGSPTTDNWTHRSVHPQTELDWYFSGALQAAYKLELNATTDLKLYGGFEYTDVQWTAFGGSYIYSEGGYRDQVGEFEPGKGITYRQQFPSVVTGVKTAFDVADWTIDLGVKAGLTFSAKAIDDHWLRSIHFVEDVYTAPLLGASAGASYALNDQLNLTLSGKVDRIFLGRSDITATPIGQSSPVEKGPNASGAELFSASIKAGLSGSF